MLQKTKFADQVAEFYALLGCEIERVIKQSDYASDLVIRAKNGEKWVARCEERTEVDTPTMRDFFQVLQTERAKQAAIITTGVFTPELRQLVKGKPVHLLDGNEFRIYLHRARESMQARVHTPKQTPPSITEETTLSRATQAHTIRLKKCPYCAEEIQEAAVVCRYCGRDLRTGQTPQPAVIVQNVPQRLWSPGIAALLSLFVPGAGQIYKGKVGAGILWLFTVVIGYFLLVLPGLILHVMCIFNAASGDPLGRGKAPHTRGIIGSTPKKQKQKLSPLTIGLVVVLIILCLLGSIGGLLGPPSSSSASPSHTLASTSSVSPTDTMIPTSGGREFDYGETILLCGNYRVERGDDWETVATVCDTTTWEQVSVRPDSTYPGKALITWKVGNKHLLFAWSGDALILWEAWESP